MPRQCVKFLARYALQPRCCWGEAPANAIRQGDAFISIPHIPDLLRFQQERMEFYGPMTRSSGAAHAGVSRKQYVPEYNIFHLSSTSSCRPKTVPYMHSEDILCGLDRTFKRSRALEDLLEAIRISGSTPNASADVSGALDCLCSRLTIFRS